MNKANITTHLCRTHSDRWWTLATTLATTATRKQGTRSATRRRDPPWQHLSRDRHRAPLEEPPSRSPPLQKATVTATEVVRLHRHRTWSNLRTQIASPNRGSRSSPLRRRNRSRRSSQWMRWFKRVASMVVAWICGDRRVWSACRLLRYGGGLLEHGGAAAMNGARGSR